MNPSGASPGLVSGAIARRAARARSCPSFELEHPAIDGDGLVGRTLAHQRVAELDVGIAQPGRIAHPRRNLDARLMTRDGVGLGLNQLGRDLIGVQPLALVLVERQRPLQPRDAAGAVTVLKQGVRRHALAERIIGSGRRREVGSGAGAGLDGVRRRTSV